VLVPSIFDVFSFARPVGCGLSKQTQLTNWRIFIGHSINSTCRSSSSLTFGDAPSPSGTHPDGHHETTTATNQTCSSSTTKSEKRQIPHKDVNCVAFVLEATIAAECPKIGSQTLLVLMLVNDPYLFLKWSDFDNSNRFGKLLSLASRACCWSYSSKQRRIGKMGSKTKWGLGPAFINCVP
jgi:hypothetical protein